MKKTIIIFFLILSLSLDAATYYVAPSGGSDGNAGTNIAAPWATWQHAFDVANAGDTVYFRGGVWTPATYATLDPTLSHGHTGTYSNPICFFNYPGEVPIFDGTNITSGLTILIDHTTYIKFRGITVRNNYQEGGETVVGWYPANGGNYYFENCVSHDNGGHGWQAMIYDTLVYINCDSYNNYDPNTDGNTSDGFAGGSGGTDADTLKYTYLYGCRAWNNSDDGIDLGTTKQTYVYNCWSFLNGYEELGPLSEGTGIKTGPSNVGLPSKRVIQNCISAFNKGDAFGHNNLEDDYYGPVQTWTNNIAYKCLYGWYFSGGGTNTRRNVVMNNNIVYAMRSYFAVNFMFPNLSFVTQRTNNATMTQNSPFYTTNVTVTDADFVTTDSITGVTQMSGARKADGSLPDITFLTLAEGSDLINAGTDVGLPYNGAAPDIGYAEFTGNQIIADHTVVDRFDDIPQYYIDEVKKMWVSYAGESHSEALRRGVELLEALNPTYQAEVAEYTSPLAYTTDYLRLDANTWGDLDNATGWVRWYGEEDWYTSAAAIARTKAGITYCNESTSLGLSVLAFGLCYTDGGGDYIAATQEYIDYCTTNDYSTKVIYTTGPNDSPYHPDEDYVRYEAIRDYVAADPTLILFDFADIICYNNDGSGPNTILFNGDYYPYITDESLTPDVGGFHMSNAAAIRLAKAMWWMLARIAGWDGISEGAPEPSTETDIITFTFAEQTGAATINATNHTVSIEVTWDADVTDLVPSITLSSGATIAPTSGTARNFTTPQSYTVTAEDEATTQSWVVTVTQEEEPMPPAGQGYIIKYKGKIVKR